LAEQSRCNKCGKTLDFFDTQNDFELHRHPGYGSKYDLGYIDLHLCNNCFDELFENLRSQCVVDPLKYSEERSDI